VRETLVNEPQAWKAHRFLSEGQGALTSQKKTKAFPPGDALAASFRAARPVQGSSVGPAPTLAPSR
jgi:hypothetical protein